MTKPIQSKKEYHETMVRIYTLMNKGEKKLTQKEARQLSVMSEAAEKYENDVLGLEPKKIAQSITDNTKVFHAVEPKVLLQMMENKKHKLQLNLFKIFHHFGERFYYIISLTLITNLLII
jgi:ribosomal protein L9